MPDIKSELTKVIDQWDKPEGPTMTKAYPSVTNNITRATFDMVKNNPGITRRDLVIRLDAQGYQTNSTTSMVTQLLTRGNIQQQLDGLYALQDEYSPKPSAPKVKKEVAPPAVRPLATTEELLNTLSIVQARSLYDALQKIFGG